MSFPTLIHYRGLDGLVCQSSISLKCKSSSFAMQVILEGTKYWMKYPPVELLVQIAYLKLLLSICS